MQCLQYLYITPAATQNEEIIRTLFQKLQPFKLTAAEMLQIANLRPDKLVHLVKVRMFPSHFFL